MCRLLGYVAPGPTTAQALLGADQVDRFARLSAVHEDGWGTSWLAGDGGAAQRYRSATSALLDPEAYAAHTGDVAATARIVHLRWATAGYEVDPRNSHPFVRGEVSFAHNGAISPAEGIDELLTDESRRSLDGTTDSERYFALVVQELRAGPGDLAGAVHRAVGALRRVFPTASLNALVLGPAELVAVHANTGARGPVDSLRAMGDAAPPDHVDQYYRMHWRRLAGGAVVVASTGLDRSGWTPLAAETVTRVDLATRAVTTRELGLPALESARW